ncbi:MAG: tetratricopeptide repeat protein [Aquiluna sp.]|nr:tetratricopeptide repeat protein [Aquiluna sp.]
MATKIWVGVMSALTLLWVFSLAGRGLILLQEPDPIAQIMGLAILVLPVFAVWSIFSELRFGFRAQKLGERLEALGVPDLQLEFRASGKATKESAQSEFERVSQALSQGESWQLWFQLGQAYEANGDRKRARSAIRKAIALANDSESSQP